MRHFSGSERAENNDSLRDASMRERAEGGWMHSPLSKKAHELRSIGCSHSSRHPWRTMTIARRLAHFGRQLFGERLLCAAGHSISAQFHEFSLP